jgi:Flp pilus assembly protein TadD
LRNNGAGLFPAERETLATVLARGGYRTGAFVGAFVLDRRFGLNRGFEVYDDEIARDPDADVTLEAERRASEVVDRAVAWLRASDARPSFAWVHLWDAHTPYAPPAPHAQSYDGEIAYVDAQLGRLLTAIDRADTIVVVVGDHGEALGAHGESTHGLLLYQPTLHVPMLIAGPDVKPRVVREPVSSIDIAPTVASLLGLELPAQDGRDLLPSLLSSDARLPDTDLYAETQYPLTFGWSELTAMRRGNLKLISGPAPELYDVARDPRESANILTNERRTFRELATKLDAVRATAVATTQTSVDEETKAKLASLGYVAPVPVSGAGARSDPKTMAPLFVEFENALAAIARGDARKAVAPLTQLVRRDPANPVFRATLARVQRQLGSSADAVALYRQAVALAPRDADTWYNLGVALSECCDRNEAFAALTESARLDPARTATHNALGILLIEGGDPQRAAEAFRRATDADPRDARGWNNTGNAMRALGRVREAEDAYRKATTLAATYADPLNGLGVLLVQQRRAREAVAYFDTAIRLQPDFYEAQLNRGIALQEAGDRAGAVRQYRELLAKLPAGRAFDEQRSAARSLLAGLGES